MSKPTVSLLFSKRWPISTIFTPENMHAIFVPYSCRHPFNSRFICGNSWKTIVPQSSPLSYHLRHRFHTTFVLPEFSKHLSINQFQNFPNFPTFPTFPKFPPFPEFPPFPAFHAFPPFPAVPKVPPIPSKIFCSFVLLSKFFSPSALLSILLFSFCSSV